MRRSLLISIAGVGLMAMSGAFAYSRSRNSWVELPVATVQSGAMLPAAAPAGPVQSVLSVAPQPVSPAPAPVYTAAPVPSPPAIPTITPTIQPLLPSPSSMTSGTAVQPPDPMTPAPKPASDSFASQQAQTINTCNGTPAAAYFRSAPRLGKDVVVGSVRRGATVYLTGVTSSGSGLDWYEVQLSSGQTGWIASCFVNG